MLQGIFSLCERLILKFMHQRRAAIAPLAAVMFPVIFGMAALGSDVSTWMQERNNIQTAADAAALAGAYEAMSGTNTDEAVEAAALREALVNGWRNDPDNGSEIDVTFTAGGADGVGTEVQVTLRMPTYTWFAGFFVDEPIVATTAGVRIIRPNNFCMLALDPDRAGAIYVAGDASINAPGCSIAANSSSDRSFLLQGNYDLTVGEVSLAGDYDEIGNAGTFENDGIDTDRGEPLEDPYADLEVPEFDAADCETFSAPADGIITNTGTRVFCGSDVSLGSTTDWVFEPGTYILNGVDLSVTGSGTVTAEGVTFVLTGSGSDYAQVSVHGSGDMTFTAPTDEDSDFPGISFFQDPNAPYESNDPNILNGGSEIILNGVAYFPSQPLVFGGNNSAQVPACSMVIAATIEIHGTPNMDTSCDGIPVEHIDPPAIRLIF